MSQEINNPTDLKSQSNSHQDGFEIFFVEQPPKELPLKCYICLELLTDPCILDCDCGSNFCKVCIEKVKKNHYPCPLCQQQFTTIFPNKQLQRTLNGLMTHCSHRADGCSWMDELGKLKQHLNRMPTNETRLEGCGHTDILCQYCKKFIPRKDLELHMEKKCLLAPVLCEFRYAGCEVELTRQDMANYLRDSIMDHMTFMSLKHREEVSALKKENQLVKQECADVKGENKRLQSQLDVVIVKLKTRHLE
ncbi:TNF receptor-associated factor 6-like [Halichondria panicea]|uniref:TNF receptor-associated factor 6-like n=1 Tax=Halichondria panicea TaxID=6063 RepID=UPI00312B874F